MNVKGGKMLCGLAVEEGEGLGSARPSSEDHLTFYPALLQWYITSHIFRSQQTIHYYNPGFITHLTLYKRSLGLWIILRWIIHLKVRALYCLISAQLAILRPCLHCCNVVHRIWCFLPYLYIYSLGENLKSRWITYGQNSL